MLPRITDARYTGDLTTCPSLPPGPRAAYARLAERSGLCAGVLARQAELARHASHSFGDLSLDARMAALNRPQPLLRPTQPDQPRKLPLAVEDFLRAGGRGARCSSSPA